MGTTIALVAVCLTLAILATTLPRRRRKLRIGLIALALAAAIAVPLGRLGLVGDPGPQPVGDARVLYVVEFLRPAPHEDHADRLIRATLRRDGHLVTETILTTPAGFFGEPGQARVVEGRYIVTQHGGVIDAHARCILHDQRRGYLRGIDGGQAIYRLYDPSSDLRDALDPLRAGQFGVFAVDLKTGARRRPGARHWSLEGVKSPDGTRSISQSSRGVLLLNTLDGETRELAPGERVTRSRYAGDFETPVPCLWLDNSRILTQAANGRLVVIDLQGRVTPVCSIANVPAVLDGPRLWRDPRDRIIYTCGRAEYVIDVARRTAAPLEEYALGHGFETTVETGTRGLRPIRYKDQAIGSGVFAPDEIRTAPGTIARRGLGDLGSRRDVAVLWTELGPGWRSFDLDYGGVIGWAE